MISKNLFWTALFCSIGTPSQAVSILVDYSYDTNNFFNTQEKRDALAAAASRWSGILADGNLNAVTLSDNSTDARIGFSHPGTGNNYQVSSANSSATDALAGSGVANEYRGGWSISADTWILYAGGRSIASAGLGGTGTGLNFASVFDDPNSVLNRGFNVGAGSLPMWGGSITFDNDGDTVWHFGINSAAPAGTVDFYTIALHEIGHALGLGIGFNDWDSLVSEGSFTGANAIAAYNADNNTSLTTLALDGGSHWLDGAYDSEIFSLADPNLAGTVGEGNPQDLLMEPVANFIHPTVRRFEATHTDVAALRDVGWTIIPEPTSSMLLLGSAALLFRRKRH